MSLYFSLYSPLRKWIKGEYPISPNVNIELKAFYQDQKGRLLLGGDLMTATEIDHKVDAIIGELEAIRKQAKIELKQLQLKMSKR